MSILKSFFNRSKKDMPIVLGQDTLAKIGLARDQSIRIPQSSTSGGAGFGDQITDSDREWAVNREPVAYRVTYTVADDCFDKWFTVDDPRTEGGDEDLDRKVQTVLRALKTKAVFSDASALERVYGWSIIVIGFGDAHSTKDLEKEAKKGSEVKELVAYPKTKVTSIEREKNPESPRYGEPIIYNVDRGSGKRLRVHHSRVIHLQTKPSGMSVLNPVWDDLTTLRNIRWAMGQTMFRYGSGFIVITIKGKTLAQLKEYAESGELDDILARTFFLGNENVQLEFKGMQGSALNPEPYYKPIMENISAGTGIPEAILRGAQAGALTGSEVNEREYFKVISSLQSKFEPYIRWLIDRIIESGQAQVNIEDYEINWASGFEPSAKDKAQTELLFEQAQDIRSSYMTIDELRAKASMGPMANGEGNVVLGIKRVEAKGQSFGGTSLSEGIVAEQQPQEQERSHPALVEALKSIILRVKDGSISKEQALGEAKRTIEIYINQEKDRAKAFISARTGRIVVILAPEQEEVYRHLLEQYLDDFSKILGEALK